MIRVSLNELAVRMSRALQGVGLPAGVADDAAAIVAWHDIAGLDGISQLRAALPRLRPAACEPPAMTDADGAPGIDADGESLLVLGGVLVDWIECASTGTDQPIGLTNARDLGLVGGVAALAADRGLPATFRASAEGTAYHAVSDGGTVRFAFVPDTEAGPAPTGRVEAWTAIDLGRWPPAGAGHVLDPDDLAEHRHTALTRGVPVDAAAWNAIYDLAKRVLVDDSGA